MPIQFYEKNRVFKLDTAFSSYVFSVHPEGYLLHLYYGSRIEDVDLEYLAYTCHHASVSPSVVWDPKEVFSKDTARMEYPCIKYKKARPRMNHADDMRYFNKDHYELIVISDDPDTNIPDRIIEEFKYCSINTYYSADNLTHCSMDLYF